MGVIALVGNFVTLVGVITSKLIYYSCGTNTWGIVYRTQEYMSGLIHLGSVRSVYHCGRGVIAADHKSLNYHL